MGALGNPQLWEGTADVGRSYGTFGITWSVRQRARGGERMNRAQTLVTEVLEIVGDRCEAEVLVDVGTSSLTRFANSFIHQNVSEDVEEVTLRVALDGRVASSTTTATTAAALAPLGRSPRCADPRRAFPVPAAASPAQVLRLGVDRNVVQRAGRGG